MVSQYPLMPESFWNTKLPCNGHVCIDLIAPNAPWIKFRLNMARNEVFWWFKSRIVLYICINQLRYRCFNKRGIHGKLCRRNNKTFSEERRYVNETIKKGSGMDDSLFKDMGKCGNVTPLLNLGCKTDGLIFAF